jgi:hypothetical protein
MAASLRRIVTKQRALMGYASESKNLRLRYIGLLDGSYNGITIVIIQTIRMASRRARN